MGTGDIVNFILIDLAMRDGRLGTVDWGRYDNDNILAVQKGLDNGDSSEEIAAIIVSEVSTGLLVSAVSTMAGAIAGTIATGPMGTLIGSLGGYIAGLGAAYLLKDPKQWAKEQLTELFELII